MAMHSGRLQPPDHASRESPRRVLLVAPTGDGAAWPDGDGSIIYTSVASREGIAGRNLRHYDALIFDWTGREGEAGGPLTELRGAGPSLAVIALIPPQLAGVARAARQAGATLCVIKTPDYRSQLPQAIEAAIEQARLRGENRRLARALQAAKRRRHALQRQLGVLLDRLVEGVLILDAGNGRVVAANAAAEQLWGVPLRGTGKIEERAALRAEAADGTPIPAEASAPLRALRRGEATYDESVVLQPDARRIPATVDAVPLHAPDGTLASVVSLVRDRSASTQLASLRESLVAVASHQLKNPLTVILGYSALLLKSSALDGDTRARRAVTKIRGESLRLRHLADNLLEFSRLESGRGAIQALPFDLADLVRAVATRRGETSGSRPIRLQIAPTMISCVGDYGRLAQVLGCLIERQASVNGGWETGIALGRHTAAALADAGVVSALPPDEAFATIGIGGGEVADAPGLGRAAWRPFTASEQPGDDADLDVLVSAALVRKHGGMLYVGNGGRGEEFLLVLPVA
jgi:signal transduction histidine kinase